MKMTRRRWLSLAGAAALISALLSGDDVARAWGDRSGWNQAQRRNGYRDDRRSGDDSGNRRTWRHREE